MTLPVTTYQIIYSTSRNPDAFQRRVDATSPAKAKATFQKDMNKHGFLRMDLKVISITVADSVDADCAILNALQVA